MKTINRDQLESFLNKLLDVNNFQDYGPNGLQIEGKSEIKRIAFAVSATYETVNKAVELNADALIVHHGLFWKFHGPKTITKAFYKRVAPLIKNDISLYSYHLPLDAHPEYGNAAAIAKKLQLKDQREFGEYKRSPLGISGKFQNAKKVSEVQIELEKILGHHVMISTPNKSDSINSIGIITGGANNEWYFCLQEGVDAYLTGEMSEHNWNEAKESGVHMFAGGHYATEQFGVESLQDLISTKFSIDCHYITVENPA